MKTEKIAAVIVLYNPSKQYENIIKELKGVIDKIILIDNSDNVSNVRIKKYKNTKYVKNPKNYGIAYALNQGAEEALKSGCKWLLTMDQDSEITKNVILDMLDFLKETNIERIGVVSPYHDIDTIERKPIIDIEERLEVMTSGNLINLNAYKQIGGFKNWLFIDDVDIEYCLNLNSNNFKVIRLNYIKMKHNLGNMTTVKFLGRKFNCSNHSAERRYYMVRNAFYIKKLYGNIYPEYCKFLLSVQRGQIRRILLFEKNKIKKLRLMLKGYFDYKRNITGKLEVKNV